MEQVESHDLEITFSTARSKNARQAGVSGGIIGYAIGATVAHGDEANGLAQLRRIREATGDFEEVVVVTAMEERLKSAGLVSGAKQDGRLLALEATSVGLEGIQPGLFVVSLRVKARLRDRAGAVSWSSFAVSSSAKSRSLDEYTAKPDLYRADVTEAAQDVARQLVEGPIRR